MRVYEYAKEKGVSTKEVIAALRSAGIPVASHMAVLTPQALELLSKDQSKEQKAAPQKEKKLEPVAPPSAPQPTQEKQKMTQPIQEKKVAPQEPLRKSFAPRGAHTQAPQPIPPRRPIAAPSMVAKTELSKEVAAPVAAKPILLQPTVLADFAEHVGRPFTDVIFTLLKWKILSNKNQLLPIDLVQKLADHYQITTVRPEPVVKSETKTERVAIQKGSERLPIVVVMGHVDHGKTTLLDFIRKTRVASREKGGITQHLGAYEAKTPQGSVIFLDTPGHEAFSKIRMRGAKVADIAILVVAVDDGVMPQTVEALKQAQAMEVPVIVALNKIDKAEQARIDQTKNELAQKYNLMPEEWGGSTIYVPISAKLGTNIDKLLEMILLQTQMMELKAEPQVPAKGYVLESKMEKGLGTVATFIAQQGTLHIGDYFVSGDTTGRANVLVDSFGHRVAQVGPSMPVQVAGFDSPPEAGDIFEVVSKDQYAQAKKRTENQKVTLAAHGRVSNEKNIKLIVKSDTASSQEAILEGIGKISKKLEYGYLVLHAGIGKISESDVMLAADTGARIVGFHVKPEPNAAGLAQRLGIVIESFDIIYKMLEQLQAYADSLKTVKMIRTKVGEAFVRKVFDIKNLGIIAGSYVKEGIFTRDGKVTIWRGTRKVGEGPITSLQRDRRSVKEVHAGFECAFMVANFTEWEVDDRVECFADRPEST